MGSLTIAILLGVFFLIVNAQLNYRCRTTPSRWMGNSFLIDYDTKYARFSEIYYSATTEIVYEKIMSRGSSGREYDQEWFDFRTQTKYNQSFGGECRSYSFSRPFTPFGVPSDAKFEGRSTFGALVENLPTQLKVDFFSGDADGGRYHTFWAPVTTIDSVCVPVLESYIRESSSTAYPDRRNIHITYTNLTTSFENPPEPCTPVSFNGRRFY